jgi:hypothetical protein
MKRFWFLSIFFLQTLPKLAAQQTVGLFLNDSLAFNGYTLLVPPNYPVTYLIDNCGNVVHTWTSDYDPGLSAYLLENGNLLRTARIPSNFPGGGTGGRIELFDWDSNLLWSYNYSSVAYHQHHDVMPMPNGHILLIAWEDHSEQEAIDAGRQPGSMPASGLWSEQVVELEPVGTNGATIVWQWRLWDHLVQDFDATKLNFGNVSEHPELANINFTGAPAGLPGPKDWIHLNSVDYNAELDQVLVSSRALSEVWVIDHSTSTQEAAGHTGGTQGKGGDFLFRWGNPQVYGRGSSADQQFFGQHSAHWILPGLLDAGRIMVFNNGLGRPDGDYSSVDIIAPPVATNGSYPISAGQPFAPAAAAWTYAADPPTLFLAGNTSGAQRQPNGNTLVCDGPRGRIFEITQDEELAWDYISPVFASGPATQGQNASGSSLFRAQRYAPDYAGLAGKDLTPSGPIELNPLPANCELFVQGPSAAVAQPSPLASVRMAPNPAGGHFYIENKNSDKLNVTVSDLAGRIVCQLEADAPVIYCETDGWGKGLYVVQITDSATGSFIIQKMIKL